MALPLRPWPVPPAVPPAHALRVLEHAVAEDERGCDVVLAPTSSPDGADTVLTVQPGSSVGACVAVATSGTTGSSRLVLLPNRALIASARATQEVLGGPGHWLLALPAQHVAGVQVLVRSLVAGTTPTVLPRLGAGADTADLVAGIDAMPDGRRYAALVPTQIHRALADPAARDALAGLDAVLVGGSALPPTLRERAAADGVTLVATYGMAETSGGCVYDGVPLPGVRVALDEDGRVLITGPTLASGYLEGDTLTPLDLVTGRGPDDADRDAGSDPVWLRTRDTGVLIDGVLRITGRVEDLVITGGLKVAPGVVERAVLEHVDGAREAAVVGVPDAEWGEVLALVLAVERGATIPDLDAVRAILRAHLPGHALPRRLRVVAALPRRAGLEKVDRDGVRVLADGPPDLP